MGSAWKRGQQQAQQTGLFLLLLVIGANGVSGCEGAGRKKFRLMRMMKAQKRLRAEEWCARDDMGLPAWSLLVIAGCM